MDGKDGLMLTKLFTSLVQWVKARPRLMFILYVVGFYILLVLLYRYMIQANLSTAPDFVYNQF